MCQDFDMPNCIRLWDTLFADPNRYEFLNYVCVAIVVQVREIILDGDFATCMETLQSETKRISDVNMLLEDACEIKEKYKQRLAYEDLKQTKQ